MTIGRRLLSGTRSRDRGLAADSVAVLLGLVAIAGQSITDDVVNLPAVCLLLVLVVGWIDGGLGAARDQSEPPPNRPPLRLPAMMPLGRIVGALALIALIASVVPISAFDRAALAVDDGNAAAVDRGLDHRARDYDDALALDPA